ncbi:hypothetical protein EON81_00075 [bacterium]|nr:MAG: hypothetical protein EON81_00075 [bacterium]
MRTFATVALSLLITSSFAQGSTYSRITLDPTLSAPTGDVFCLDLAPNNYSLIAASAANLSRDSGPGLQYYITTPEGVSERIPIESVGGIAAPLQSMNGYEFPSRGQISPDGTAAIIQLSDGLYSYRRQGKLVKKIPLSGSFPSYINMEGLSVGFVSNTKAIVGKFEGNRSVWMIFYSYDLETGALTPLPLSITPSYRFPLERTARIVGEGKKLVYRSLEGKVVLYNLASGASTQHDVPASADFVVDDTGNYLYWTEYDAGLTLREKDLRNGQVTTVLTRPEGAGFYFHQSKRRRIFAYTQKIDANGADVAGTETVFDVATGKLRVLNTDGSGKAIPGLSRIAFFAPDGQTVVYHAKEYEGYVGPQGRYPYRFAYRQAVGGTRAQIAKPVVPGGGNASAYVRSPRGYSVLYRTKIDSSGYSGRLSLTRSTDQVAVSVPTATYGAAPVAVDEAGRYCVFWEKAAPAGGISGSHLWVYDSQTGTTKCVTAAFTSGVGEYPRAAIDEQGQVFFVVDTTGIYPGLTGTQLFRFDIASQALKHFQSQGAFLGDNIAVGGGRVVTLSGTQAAPTAIVFSASAGRPILTIPLPTWSLRGFQISDNHKTLAYSPLSPRKTYLYNLEDGSLKGEYADGDLTPSGEWLVGTKTATYLATGATFPVDRQYAGLGAPLGPVVVTYVSNTYSDLADNYPSDDDRGLDIVRYRIPILTAPKLVKTRALASPVGVTVEATVLGAGLQNVEKWYEARVDGGLWQKFTTVTGGLSATEGVRTIELRAKDALGRISEIESYAVDVDRTAPSLSNIVVTPGTNDATVTFATNEIVYFEVTPVGVGNPLDGTSGETKGEFRLTNLIKNRTYRFTLKIVDRAGNATVSETISYRTKAS